MAVFPQVTDNYFLERAGVMRVGLEINKLGLIFRETPNGDVGIDAQIELVNSDGQAIGKIVAAQIKSGQSHVSDKGDYWVFYPKEKHREYWEGFPIPVFVLIFIPSENNIFFADARYQLNIPDNAKYIKIPKQNILSSATRNQLFETMGGISEPFMQTGEILDYMMRNRCENPTFSVSFFDLFVQGLTNICRQLFFSMSLAIDIAEYNNETEYEIGIGFDEHEFLHKFVRFITRQNLAKVDYADYLIDYNERQLQPTFLAPITGRGRLLMQYISQEEKRYEALTEIRLVSEMLLRREYLPSDYQRLEKAKRFSLFYLQRDM